MEFVPDEKRLQKEEVCTFQDIIWVALHWLVFM